MIFTKYKNKLINTITKNNLKMTSPIERKIVIDMTITKTQQKNFKIQRWQGYNIAIIKDSDSALEKLQEIILRKKIHRNMTIG